MWGRRRELPAHIRRTPLGAVAGRIRPALQVAGVPEF
jgi:hypothetical protein